MASGVIGHARALESVGSGCSTPETRPCPRIPDQSTAGCRTRRGSKHQMTWHATSLTNLNDALEMRKFKKHI